MPFLWPRLLDGFRMLEEVPPRYLLSYEKDLDESILLWACHGCRLTIVYAFFTFFHSVALQDMFCL